MRSLLARARDVRDVARTKLDGAVATVAAARRETSQLDLALRRVTHTDCAAIPAEDVQNALQLILESEDSLAKALRHIQENVVAPAEDWRRINGALALFEALANSKEGAALVGRSWYEVKMEARLKELQNFRNDSDPRVATLIHRAALGASRAAMALQWDEDVLDAAPEEVRRDVDAVDADAAVAPERTGDGGAPRTLNDRWANPAIIGRRTEETVTDSSVPSAPANDNVARRRCCCCWPRQQAVLGRKATADDEEDSLLTPKQGGNAGRPAAGNAAQPSGPLPTSG